MRGVKGTAERTERLEIRLTPDEKKILRRLADEKNITVTALLLQGVGIDQRAKPST